MVSFHSNSRLERRDITIKSDRKHDRTIDRGCTNKEEFSRKEKSTKSSVGTDKIRSGEHIVWARIGLGEKLLVEEEFSVTCAWRSCCSLKRSEVVFICKNTTILGNIVGWSTSPQVQHGRMVCDFPKKGGNSSAATFSWSTWRVNVFSQ